MGTLSKEQQEFAVTYLLQLIKTRNLKQTQLEHLFWGRSVDNLQNNAREDGPEF